MLPESLKNILLNLHPLEEEVLNEIAQRLERTELEKKELLLRQKQVCKYIYFIEKGFLRSFYNEGDNEVTTWFMKEHDFIISVKSFFDQQASYESIEAVEDCILYYISYEDLIQLYEKFHSFTFVGLMLTQHYYKQSEDRLFNLRKKDAFERYQYLVETYPEITLRCPLKHIASYLGITLETLSRIRGRKI
ncbi:Crp/Fnr family transcriptional regulator [Pinibacter aurantiacus]|uniref:Crp/Fnr family transcriptional regulator n=1 Tax=Pinibacter aurantiacus TaxID=2851599 RepID=A0A9E2W239_9BACT|nr:Crp/Fnr family transcriptional regulator [Pinibacter aurantiacus]MBV4356880.1 Crp/Fnr family transcriptional regulator [Pinibacter aurantiacus]